MMPAVAYERNKLQNYKMLLSFVMFISMEIEANRYLKTSAAGPGEKRV